jgi:phosphate-selective porin OprO/OprP
MHVGLAAMQNTYAITPGTSSQTDTALPTTTRGTISSFRSAGRGLNNIFRAQIAGQALETNAGSFNTSSEFGAKVEQTAVGLEGIFAKGPSKIMGEYSQSQYKTEFSSNSINYDTATFYVEAGYFLTGEKYADSYKNGVFSGFKPKNNFDLDTKQSGAIELAFRVEGFRVDDTSITGSTSSRFQGTLDGTSASGVKSKANTYTAGIRWILNPNVIFKVNYAYTKLGNNYAPIDLEQSSGSSAQAVVNSEQLFMTRMQYMF